MLVFTSTFTYAQVDINSASKDELDKLKNIGPVRAQAIIDYRAKNGPFKSKEDLIKVDGIGEKNFAEIKDDIKVGRGSAVAVTPAKAVKEDKMVEKDAMKAEKEKAKEAKMAEKEAMKAEKEKAKEAKMAEKEAMKAEKEKAKEAKMAEKEAMKAEKAKADKKDKK